MSASDSAPPGGPPPTAADIRAARDTIAPLIRETPVVADAPLSGRLGAGVHLKLELQQETGSFKVRGAANCILRLPTDAAARGVVAMSTGNHGRAVAWVARQRGLRAVICLSSTVPRNKMAEIEALGAELRRVGQTQDEAQADAERLVREEGLAYVPPFDHPHIIAGQGTLGLELLEQVPHVRTVLVPLSGGGLIAGIALALKAARPDTRVVGLSVAGGAAMAAALRAGRPVPTPEPATLADSLLGGIGAENRYTLPLVRDLVDEVVELDEATIATGMRHLHTVHGLSVEGAGAVGVGALLSGAVDARGQETAILVSGGNVDPAQFRQVLAG